ncbi:MAG: DUF1611 domain-containing protein, partial [Planctomycetes bacterium]|nr:DUF1611 domain-containing protein [Planctomycetota bacterium]
MADVSAYKRILLLTEGNLGVFTSKTATVLLRFRGEDVVAVIDSAFAGQDLPAIIPASPARPILADVSSAAQLEPDVLFVGIHPAGGALPATFRQQIAAALRVGIDVVSGLHTQLARDDEFRALASQSGARLIDVRCPP